MELSPGLREAIDLAKAVASAVCEIIRTAAGIKEGDAPEQADRWDISIMDEATLVRLKKAVADYSRAAERLDEFDTRSLEEDIVAARRRFKAPPPSLYLGATHTGFALGYKTRHVSAFRFMQTLADIAESNLTNYGQFLFEEDLPLSRIDPSRIAFFCGSMTAFGLPAPFEVKEIHQELEREAAAVQRMRDRHESWNAIASAAEALNDSVLSESEQAVLDYVRRKPFCTAKQIAGATGLVQSSIERHFLPALKKRKLIRNRRGRGYYPSRSN